MVDWKKFLGFHKELHTTNGIYSTPYPKNKTLQWMDIGDTKERFEKNFKDRYQDLLKDELVELEIDYKFNSDGFRSEDFKESNNAIFLGCSTTIGNGVNFENTYPYIVSNNLNVNCCNLGIDGASNDTVFRLFFAYFKKLNPKYVIVLSPFMERLEYLVDSSPVILRPTQLGKTSDKIDARFKKFYTSILTDDDNFILNRQKNIEAIRSCCLQNNVTFLSVNREEVEHIDNARDLIHIGVKSHQLLAEKVLSEL